MAALEVRQPTEKEAQGLENQLEHITAEIDSWDRSLGGRKYGYALYRARLIILQKLGWWWAETDDAPDDLMKAFKSEWRQYIAQWDFTSEQCNRWIDLAIGQDKVKAQPRKNATPRTQSVKGINPKELEKALHTRASKDPEVAEAIVRVALNVLSADGSKDPASIRAKHRQIREVIAMLEKADDAMLAKILDSVAA